VALKHGDVTVELGLGDKCLFMCTIQALPAGGAGHMLPRGKRSCVEQGAQAEGRGEEPHGCTQQCQCDRFLAVFGGCLFNRVLCFGTSTKHPRQSESHVASMGENQKKQPHCVKPSGDTEWGSSRGGRCLLKCLPCFKSRCWLKMSNLTPSRLPRRARR